MTGVVAQGILSTKIYRPPLPPDLVRRPELLRRLDEGRSRPLTLVSAPAGYGKSALVSSWLEESDWASVWVSLDEGDGDLQRFLSYASAAIHERFPETLETTQDLSQTAQFPSTEAAAAIIANEVNAIDQPFFLVLDDYHRIHADSPVHDLVRILLDHPPIPLHLVVLTRRDPPLPLGRLRGLGQVTEVRMQELRFSASETRELLEQAAHIKASADGVANIDRELEGWAAGLRLMTLALERAPDPEAFLAGFRGGTQQMQEYLVSEVLAGLPANFRAWLLRSALLDRFCAPLCEALCGDLNGDESEALSGASFVDQLQHANLFLVPLDGYGRWFRFHHLFQSLLQAEARRQLDFTSIAKLYGRAGTWFEENGFVEDAIGCALKAGDADQAAEILQRHRLDELERLNWPVVARWLDVLGAPSAGRPDLQLAEAFVAVRRFDVPRLAAILEAAAPAIEDNPGHAHLIGELRCLQGILHYRLGDGETSRKLLLEACQRYAGREKRGIAGFAATHETLSLGLCGQGEEAINQNEEFAMSAASGDPICYSLVLVGRVGLCYLMGDVTRAANESIQLHSIAQAGGAEFPLGLSLAFWVSSNLQRGDFQSAVALSDAIAQRRFTMPLRMAFSAMAALALSHQLRHEDAAASRVTSDLLALAQAHNQLNGLETAQACEARIRLLQGDLNQAARWAGVDGEPASFAELFMSVEVPAITRARIWIAQGTDESLNRALCLARGTSRRAQEWHVTIQAIEADVLSSLALAGLGREDEALKCLAEAVKRAAHGGCIRPFLEPGRPMADLLGRLDSHGLATDYSRHLEGEIEAWLASRNRPALAASGLEVTVADGLNESLTARELDILGLLGKRLQNKEIARALSVSPETVKTHLKNLYSKLGVANRREAAARSQLLLAEARHPKSAA